MLYRKTTTAFSAVILGVMALLGATAHAVNLDLAGTRTQPFDPITFSKESLPYLAAGQTHYNISVPSASQSALNLVTTLGRPIPDNTGRSTDGLGGIAVRYDLQNLQFRVQLAQENLWIGDSAGMRINPNTLVPRRVAAGGSGAASADARCDGRTCVVFEIGTSGRAMDGTEILNLIVWDKLRVHPDGGGMARVRIYSDFDNAMAAGAGGLRKDSGWKPAVNIASSVTTRIAGGTPAVADVAAMPRFTNFAPPGIKTLGSVNVTVAGVAGTAPPALEAANAANVHYLADGTGVVTGLDDIRPASAGGGITLTDTTGSLAFGSFSFRASCASAAGMVAVVVPAEGDNAGRGSAALFAGTRSLCVAPRPAAVAPGSPNRVIPATVITAEVSYNAISGRRYAAVGAMGTVGTIVRNGATVQISYVTVSDRYNQRIIITNRSAAAAEYELSKFYTEDGTEGAAGETASGTVPAESSVVVLTRDAVTFTGSRSRGSATLAVTAPASTISVATTQVNLSDGSTDTINYEVTGAGAN